MADKQGQSAPLDELVKHKQLAILLIDLQEEYLQRLARTHQNRLLSGAQRLVSYAARAELPVAYVEQKGFGSTVSPLLEQLHTIRSDRRHGFVKTGFDAFEDPYLATWLRERGCQAIGLAGHRRSVCLRQTAWSAEAKEFTPFLIRDAAYDRIDFSKSWDPQTDGSVLSLHELPRI